jgi:thioredoxin 2
MMAPAFERAAMALEPDVRLLKLNADSAQATCTRFGVRGIPAVFLYQGGKATAQASGAMNADAIVHWARGQLAVLAH